MCRDVVEEMQRPWADLDDATLLAASGEHPDAFATLYRRYEAVIAGWLLRRCGDPHVAADLTAETFARALLHAARFKDRGGQQAVGWLLAIAGNLHPGGMRWA